MYIIRILAGEGKSIMYGYSLGSIVQFKNAPELIVYTNSFDVLVTDGTPFYHFCRMLKVPVKFNISIPNLANLILRLANKERYSILLFGARQEINDRACMNLRRTYSDIILHPGINGYFMKAEEPGIATRINHSDPDILFIGISWPVKERFAYEYRDFLKARIIVPCGGMIDVWGEKTRQTPPLLKKLGLASLYRLIQEPGRLGRTYKEMYYLFFVKFVPKMIRVLISGDKEFSIPAYFAKGCRDERQ